MPGLGGSLTTQTKPSEGVSTCVISIGQLPSGCNSNWLVQFPCLAKLHFSKVPQMVNMGHL